MYYIYAIYNEISGRYYVGSTSNFVKRKDEHIRGLKNGYKWKSHNKKGSLWKKDFEKGGLESFHFFILEIVDAQVGLPYRYEREQHYINQLDTLAHGYNVQKPSNSLFRHVYCK